MTTWMKPGTNGKKDGKTFLSLKIEREAAACLFGAVKKSLTKTETAN